MMRPGMQVQAGIDDTFFAYQAYRLYQDLGIARQIRERQGPGPIIEYRMSTGSPHLAGAYFAPYPDAVDAARQVGFDDADWYTSSHDGLSPFHYGDRVVEENEVNIEWGDFDYEMVDGEQRQKPDAQIIAANTKAVDVLAHAALAMKERCAARGHPVLVPLCAWSPRPSCDGLVEAGNVKPQLSLFRVGAQRIREAFDYIALHNYFVPCWPDKAGWADEGVRVYGRYGGLRILEAFDRIVEAGLADLPIWIGETNREMIQDPGQVIRPVPPNWPNMATRVGLSPTDTTYSDGELAKREYEWLCQTIVNEAAKRGLTVMGSIWFLWTAGDDRFKSMQAASRPVRFVTQAFSPSVQPPPPPPPPPPGGEDMTDQLDYIKDDPAAFAQWWNEGGFHHYRRHRQAVGALPVPDVGTAIEEAKQDASAIVEQAYQLGKLV